MNSLEIKRATVKDLNALQLIGRQTFSETFADVNSEENMIKYLKESFADEKLTAELNNPNSHFYLAQLDNKVIGYLKLNTGDAQTEKQDHDALEIERISWSKCRSGSLCAGFRNRKRIACNLYLAWRLGKEF